MSPETRDTAATWITELIKSVGFPIVVCGVLLYFGAMTLQEDRADNAADKEFIRTALTEMQTDSTKALGGVEAALEKNSEVIEQNTEVLERIERNIINGE